MEVIKHGNQVLYKHKNFGSDIPFGLLFFFVLLICFGSYDFDVWKCAHIWVRPVSGPALLAVVLVVFSVVFFFSSLMRVSAEPQWYQGHVTPYYNESHAEWRAKIRAFVEKEISPFVHEWDEAGKYPRELHKKAYEAGRERERKGREREERKKREKEERERRES